MSEGDYHLVIYIEDYKSSARACTYVRTYVCKYIYKETDKVQW